MLRYNLQSHCCESFFIQEGVNQLYIASDSVVWWWNPHFVSTAPSEHCPHRHRGRAAAFPNPSPHVGTLSPSSPCSSNATWILQHQLWLINIMWEKCLNAIVISTFLSGISTYLHIYKNQDAIIECIFNGAWEKTCHFSLSFYLFHT